jgi:hypothetical protein
VRKAMPRIKSNVEKKRKTIEIAVKHLDMLAYIKKKHNMDSDTEALRWCIANTFSIEKMEEDSIEMFFKDKEGKIRGVIFL